MDKTWQLFCDKGLLQHIIYLVRFVLASLPPFK